MININRLNKHLGTNFKKYYGSFNGFKYVVIRLDNSMIYFNKELNKYTKIKNLDYSNRLNTIDIIKDFLKVSIITAIITALITLKIYTLNN